MDECDMKFVIDQLKKSATMSASCPGNPEWHIRVWLAKSLIPYDDNFLYFTDISNNGT